MKKLLALLLAAMMVLSLAACGQQNTDDNNTPDDTQQTETRTLRLAHRNSDTHMFTPLIDEFAERVYEETNGEIKIEVYGNNILGDVDDILEQVQMGSVDINLGGVGNLGKFSPKYNSAVLPFLFESYDHAYATINNDFLDWVHDDFESMGFYLLNSVWAAGFREMTSNYPINSAADVSGLKVRVPATQANNEFVLALNGITETVAFGELYTALKQNVVDAQENPLATIYANQYYDCQKYLAMTNHLYDFDVMVFNEDVWNSLTESQQEVIAKLAEEYGEKASKMMADSDADLIAKLEEAGMTICYPDISEFQAAMDPAYANLSKVYGEENVQTMLEMAEKNK